MSKALLPYILISNQVISYLMKKKNAKLIRILITPPIAEKSDQESSSSTKVL